MGLNKSVCVFQRIMGILETSMYSLSYHHIQFLKEDNHQDISEKNASKAMILRRGEERVWRPTICWHVLHVGLLHPWMYCIASRSFFTIPSLKVGEDITTGVNNWPWRHPNCFASNAWDGTRGKDGASWDGLGIRCEWGRILPWNLPVCRRSIHSWSYRHVQ